MVSASGLSTRSSRWNSCARLIAPLRLLDRAPPHKFDHARLQVQVRLPQLAIVDVFDSIPGLRLAAALVPSRAQMAVIQPEHLRRQPGGDVHAVGDVADRHRVFRFAGRQPCPHGARNFAVQRRNRIGAPRHLQPQHGHAEPFVAVGILASERHELFFREPERLAQKFPDVPRSGRHRSGRGPPAPGCGS